MSYTKKVRSMYKRQPNTLVVLAFKNGSREQPARVAAPNLRMVIYYMCLIHHTHFNFTPKIFYLELQGRLHHSSSHYPWHPTASTICRHVNSTCATHTPHNSWRSLISGGCRTSMEHSMPQLVQDAPSLPVFRRELKTVLFQSSFPAD